MTSEPVPPLLDLVLHPHRSLSPTGFWVLMGLLSGFSFAAGLTFFLIGAWPVIGFLGLDVVVVYWAFRASYASGRTFEHLQLTREALTVSRRHPSGREERWTLQPDWLRVEIEPRPGRCSILRLTSHGRSLTIGAFLPADEREEVAALLREALVGLRQGAAPTTAT